jgi:RimJ/RimL family protein N-acetyltransferase
MTNRRGLNPVYPVRTARLDLRPHRRDDLDDLLAFHSQPEVVRYLQWPVRDREQTQTALEAKLGQGVVTEPGQSLVLAMELRRTSTVIGEVVLKWESEINRQGEIEFAVHRAHQGQGFAAEAAQAVLRLGFNDLGLHRVVAVCIDTNIEAVRLLRRLGMHEEAHLRDHVFLKGEWTNQLVFGVLEDEWRRPERSARTERGSIERSYNRRRSTRGRRSQPARD